MAAATGLGKATATGQEERQPAKDGSEITPNASVATRSAATDHDDIAPRVHDHNIRTGQSMTTDETTGNETGGDAKGRNGSNGSARVDDTGERRGTGRHRSPGSQGNADSVSR